jgi:hypothetical protein
MHAWKIRDAAGAPGSASPIHPLRANDGESCEINPEILRV